MPRSPRVGLYALLAAHGISIGGNTMAIIAVPWFVLQTTDSAAQTGLAAFFYFLPVPIAGVFGGVIVDRVGYRPSSIIADLASGLTIAMIPLLDATVGIAYWQILALVFLGTLFDTPADSARASLIPDLAAAAGTPLERASSAEQIADRAGRLLGAPLAGVLIGVLGAENVLWVDAGTFAVSALLVTIAVPSLPRADRPESASYLVDLAAGFSFLRREHLVLTIMGMIALTNFLDLAVLVALQVYADRVLDSASALGAISGLTYLGAVITALAFGVVGHRLSRWRLFTFCFLGVGLALWVYPLQLPLLVLLVSALVRGLLSGPVNPIIMTVAVERVPSGMRARVFGIANALAWIGTPLGSLAGGLAVAGFGLQPAMAILAAAYTATAVAAFSVPVLRRMDERKTVRAASPIT